MVQAAYDLRDSFKNDQQFYVKYFLTHPDLVTLDYSSRLFFTSHKSMNCRSRATVTNALSFDYYHADPDPGPGAEGKEHRAEGIGVLHANNLASNRVLRSGTSVQATDTHQRAPTAPCSGSYLGLSDSRDALAARLLSQEAVQTNSSSRGGSNLLADWLLVRHMERLGPQLVRLAAELRLCEYRGWTRVWVASLQGRGCWDYSLPQAARSVPPLTAAGTRGGVYRPHGGRRSALTSRNAPAGQPRSRQQGPLRCRLQLPLTLKTWSAPCQKIPSPHPHQPSPLLVPGAARPHGQIRSWNAPALDLLQVTLGARGEEYTWRPELLELQQRRLADKLRVNVDKCT